MPIFENEKLFKCQCHTHVLGITQDSLDRETWFTFYYYPSTKRFIYRLKMAFDILRGKQVSLDEFVFDNEQMQEIKDMLNSIDFKKLPEEVEQEYCSFN